MTTTGLLRLTARDFSNSLLNPGQIVVPIDLYISPCRHQYTFVLLFILTKLSWLNIERDTQVRHFRDRSSDSE